MKKVIIFCVTIVLMISAAMPVSAAKKPVFEKDPSVWKEGKISVYDQDIREKVNGKWTECSCYGLHFCTEMYHILEGKDKTEDFYSTFFNGDYMFFPIGQVYQDRSLSMERTFSYEKLVIFRNMSSFLERRKITNVFNQGSDLYSLLGSFEKINMGTYLVTVPKKVPIIITDLWETRRKSNPLLYDSEVVFVVPYASSNKAGVLHCEDVVNDLLWEHSWVAGCTDVYVVFTDKVIVKYSNGCYNGDFGYIRIYVP